MYQAQTTVMKVRLSCHIQAMTIRSLEVEYNHFALCPVLKSNVFDQMLFIFKRHLAPSILINFQKSQNFQSAESPS